MNFAPVMPEVPGGDYAALLIAPIDLMRAGDKEGAIAAQAKVQAYHAELERFHDRVMASKP